MESQRPTRKQSPRRGTVMGIGIAVVVAIGAAIGAAMHNVAMGVAFGAAFGVAAGALLSSKRRGVIERPTAYQLQPTPKLVASRRAGVCT